MKVNGTSGLTFPDTTTLASAGQASVRAWVNFNGTGTVAIRAAFNVTSITDNGTGNYTANFTTALPDANYSAVAQTGSVGATNFSAAQTGTYTTGSIQIFTAFVSSSSDRTLVDMPENSVAVFR
jgi:hypothetical protein